MTQSFEAELSIVGVIRPPEFVEDVETEALIESARARFDREIAELQTRANAAGVTPRITVRVGHPAEQIIAAAEDYAHCAVMVVR